MNTPRRVFFIRSLSLASALSLVKVATAQGTVSETDPQAVALGYRADSTQVDGKKYPNHSVSQSCSGCALFQGARTDASAACAVFANKQVNAKGWCSAWTKRA